MIFSINLLFTCKKESLFPNTAQAFCSGLLCIKFNENRHRTHQELSMCQLENVCVWKPFPIIIYVSSYLLEDDEVKGAGCSLKTIASQIASRSTWQPELYMAGEKDKKGKGLGWLQNQVSPRQHCCGYFSVWSVWEVFLDWLLLATLIVIICFVACWSSPSALSQFVLWPCSGEFTVHLSDTV